MRPPFTDTFHLDDGREITTVVIDETEFKKFCIEYAHTKQTDRKSDNVLGASTIGDNRTIWQRAATPLIYRNHSTEIFFIRWGVKTEWLSVIARGTARKAAK